MVWNQFAPLAHVPPFVVMWIDEGVDGLDREGQDLALHGR